MSKSDLKEKLEKQGIASFDGNQIKDYSSVIKTYRNGIVGEAVTIDDIKSAEDVEIFVKYYQEVMKRADNYYGTDNNKKEIKELQEKIQRDAKLIERLKYEGEDVNKDMIERTQDRVNKAQEELKQKEENVNEKSTRTVVLPSGREVSLKEAGEITKNNIKDAIIAFLTQKSMQIDKEIPAKKAEADKKLQDKKTELKKKEDERWNFKYTFDDQHNITNKAELEKLDKDIEGLRKEVEGLENGKEIDELLKMKEACQKNLRELKGPSIEELQEQAKAREQQKDTYDFIENTEWNGNYEVVGGFKMPQYNAKQGNNYSFKENEQWSDKYETVDVVKPEEKSKVIAMRGGAGTSGFMTYYNEADKKADVYAYESNGDFFNGKTYKECVEKVQNEFGFDKNAMKKVDPFLFSFLMDYNRKLADEMAMELIQGNSLEKFADQIQYDLTGVEKLKGKNPKMWNRYRKIAKIAEANGFEVKDIEGTRNIFDKIAGLFKKNKGPKALKGATEPQQLGAGQEPSKTVAQQFKDTFVIHYTPEELGNIVKKTSEPDKNQDQGREPGE